MAPQPEKNIYAKNMKLLKDSKELFSARVHSDLFRFKTYALSLKKLSKKVEFNVAQTLSSNTNCYRITSKF